MEALEQLAEKWRAAGYGRVSISLWRGRCLFVNAHGHPDVCYHMDSQTHNGNLKIGSKVTLSSRHYSDARRIGFFVARHRKEILEGLKDGKRFSQ